MSNESTTIEVERKLREKIRQGYLPERSLDSCEDHFSPDDNCNWFRIPEERFREIVALELATRNQHLRISHSAASS